MFCIKCGKQAEMEYLCKKCFLIDKELFEINDFEMIVCTLCGDDSKKAIEKEFKPHFKPNGKIKTLKTEIKIKGGGAEMTIFAKGSIQGITKESNKRIEIRVKKRQCENCSRISGNYHEAVIQIRGEQKEEILKKVNKTLPENVLSKFEIKKEGYDLRFTKKGEALKATNLLKKSYKIISSFTLAGEKNGKKLYRNVYSVR